MRIPRSVYFYGPAFLTECGLLSMWLAEPVHALKHFGASPLTLGLMGMFSSGGYALIALLAGWLSDKTGRRRWILASAAFQILSGLLLPYCRELWQFVFLAALHTTMLGFFWAPFMGLFSESTPHDQLSRALGNYNISWCLGGIMGSVLSGTLYDHLGPAAPFWFGSALMACALIILTSSRPAKLAELQEHPLGNSPLAPLYLRQAWALLISNFFVMGMMIYIFPKLAEIPALAISATGISLLHGVRMTAMLLTFALMGSTVFWHFRQFPVHLCYLLMLLIMIAMGLINLPWVFILPFVGFGVATGIAYGLSAYYSMLAPESKGSLVGVHEAFLSLGSTCGPIFGGMVIILTGQPAMPFWIGLIPMILLWAVCLWIQGRISRVRVLN